MAMKKIEIVINTFCADPARLGEVVKTRWPAYDVGVPGLAACRAAGRYDENGTPTRAGSTKWMVIHTDSGTRASPYLYNSRERAAEAAIAYADLADWTLSQKELMKVDGLEIRIRNAS